jgi:RNA polymerase sigma factor (sigma-70 family)
MKQFSDEELMLEYQKGKAEAMREIISRFKNPIYGFAYRIMHDAYEAEDVASEVFMKVHLAKDSYRPQAKLSTWLFTIAHNACVSRFRKKRMFVLWPRKTDDCEQLIDFESPEPSPRQVFFENEQDKVIKTCIQSLPFLQKEALILREFENMDYEQIAQILKKSLGTIKTLIHRARKNLKIKLLPYFEEQGGDSHV